MIAVIAFHRARRPCLLLLGRGAVAGVFQISKHEVTAGQYAAFLSAVAARAGDTGPNRAIYMLHWMGSRAIAPVGSLPGSASHHGTLDQGSGVWEWVEASGEMPLAELLPEDGMAGGFDTIGAALELSPVHLERYLEAAWQTRVFLRCEDEEELDGLPAW